MRLIDADALKALILKERDAIPKTTTERYGFGVENPNHHGNSMRGGIRKALRCMEQTPTVEAEPVRHGRWIIKLGRLPVCSHCYKTLYMARGAVVNYCPNCGAKMGGGC